MPAQLFGAMSLLSGQMLRRLTSPGGLALLAVPAIVSLSRLIGLLREALLSKLLGLSASLDLFVIFTTVPTYLLAYVMGPFGIAFYASLTRPGITPGGLSRRLMPWLLGGGAMIGVLVFAAAAILEPRLRDGGDPVAGYWPIAFGGGAILPLVAMIGLANCFLHAERKHVTAVALSVAQPWLFVLMLLALDLSLVSVAFWPVGCAYIVSFLLAFVLVQQGVRQMPAVHGAAMGGGELKVLRGNLGLTTVEAGGFFANQLLTMFFAGLSGAGGIAANGLVARVMLMPLSLMIAPFLPILQNAYRGKGPIERRRFFARVFGLGMAAIVLVNVGIVLCGDVIVRLFFERGAFGPEDSARVAALMLPYGVYVVFIAANQLCATAAFISGLGRAYTTTMLANYLCGNLLKIPMLAYGGLTGVIWAAAFAEGLAAAVNSWRQLSVPPREATPC